MVGMRRSAHEKMILNITRFEINAVHSALHRASVRRFWIRPTQLILQVRLDLEQRMVIGMFDYFYVKPSCASSGGV